MERVRIEEFTQDGKNFMYIDMSGLKTTEEFGALVKVIEPEIAKYPAASLYTITNLENVRFDTEGKELIVKYMEHNKPSVKYGAIIGFDGIKKIMVNMTVEESGREDMIFAFTREQAVELLLRKE